MTAGLGLACLYGWHFAESTFMRIIPALPPMHYFAGVCFILAAVGIVSAVLSAKSLELFSGYALSAIGAIDLVENTFGLPFDLPTELQLDFCKPTRIP